MHPKFGGNSDDTIKGFKVASYSACYMRNSGYIRYLFVKLNFETISVAGNFDEFVKTS